MERKIQVRVLDETGHTLLMKTPEQALETVKKYDSKWIYVDGNLIKRGKQSNISEEELQRYVDEANQITIDEPTIGG